MKINPDTMIRMVEAVKALESLPFEVSVSTIMKEHGGSDVILFDKDMFIDLFPDSEVQRSGNALFYCAKTDGMNYRLYEEIE